MDFLSGPLPATVRPASGCWNCLGGGRGAVAKGVPAGWPSVHGVGSGRALCGPTRACTGGRPSPRQPRKGQEASEAVAATEGPEQQEGQRQLVPAVGHPPRPSANAVSASDHHFPCIRRQRFIPPCWFQANDPYPPRGGATNSRANRHRKVAVPVAPFPDTWSPHQLRGASAGHLASMAR